MAKELSVLQQQAEAIKTEVNKGANTSSRIGGMFGDILEYNEGKFTELEKKVGGVGYVTCDTDAGTAAKVITVTGLTTLSTGIRLLVKMTNNNTASNATLNINSLGAKPLYYNNKIVSTDNSWEAGEVIDVYYDGTNFYSGNFQGGSGEGGNLILEWNTDAATTRKQVKQSDRKSLLQISYKDADGNPINEQYIGTTFTDTEWAKDIYWEKIPNQSDIDNLSEKIITYNSLDDSEEDSESKEKKIYVQAQIAGGLQKSNGLPYSSSDYKRSNYIPVLKGYTVYVDERVSTGPILATCVHFDSDYNFIGVLNSGQQIEQDGYIAFSGSNETVFNNCFYYYIPKDSIQLGFSSYIPLSISGYIDKSGVLQSSSGFVSSDYIPVSNGDRFYVDTSIEVAALGACISFYDAEYSFIKNIEKPRPFKSDIDGYIRLSASTSNSKSFYKVQEVSDSIIDLSDVEQVVLKNNNTKKALFPRTITSNIIDNKGNTLDKVIEDIEYPNIPEECIPDIAGYIGSNGVIQSGGTDFLITDYILAFKGDIIYINDESNDENTKCAVYYLDGTFLSYVQDGYSLVEDLLVVFQKSVNNKNCKLIIKRLEKNNYSIEDISYDKFINNGYISKNNGNYSSGYEHYSTDYISVLKGYKIYINYRIKVGGLATKCAVYTSSKTFTKTIDNLGNIEENGYIRLCYQTKIDANGFFIYKPNNQNSDNNSSTIDNININTETGSIDKRLIDIELSDDISPLWRGKIKLKDKDPIPSINNMGESYIIYNEGQLEFRIVKDATTIVGLPLSVKKENEIVPAEFSLVYFGDSVTVGVVASYINELETILTQDGHTLFNTANKGISGTNAESLYEKYKNESPVHYDYATLMIGLNDMEHWLTSFNPGYKEQGLKADEFRNWYRNSLRQLIELIYYLSSPKKLFLIIPYNLVYSSEEDTRFISSKLHNVVVQENISASEDYDYIHLCRGDYYVPSTFDYVADGIHLSSAGAKKMAKGIRDEITFRV